MINQVVGFSVNLWNTEVRVAEQLSARIHQIAPLAQVKTVETLPEYAEQKTLWVSFEEASADAIESITALLQIEFEPDIYSYHWYPA